MCPTSIMIPFNVWEKSIDQKCTELINERSASTLSQLHANGLVHHLHLNENGNQSNLPDLESDSHSDQIQSQFWRDFFTNVMCKIPRYGNSSPDQCLCKAHNKSTRLGPLVNCAPLAVTSLQLPCAVQRQNLHHLLQQLFAAENCVRPPPPRELHSCELLGPVREYHSHDQLVCSDPQKFCTFSCCHRNSRCCR